MLLTGKLNEEVLFIQALDNQEKQKITHSVFEQAKTNSISFSLAKITAATSKLAGLIKKSDHFITKLVTFYFAIMLSHGTLKL